jgi:hypothetical protein
MVFELSLIAIKMKQLTIRQKQLWRITKSRQTSPSMPLGHHNSGGDGTRTHEPLDCQSSALPTELRPRLALS